jgi:peptide-methionine (S)-S-oxide reductase
LPKSRSSRALSLTLAAVVPAAFIAALLPASGFAGPTSPPKAGRSRATFAGGCFWCMEQPFERLPGVISVVSGYTGGREKDPTYNQVSSGGTGHVEAVEIIYDPKAVTYEQLLEVFWHNVDPTTAAGQFCDIGAQYRTAIFVHDDAQRRQAEASKLRIETDKPFKGPVLTEVLSAAPFYEAEDYHQDYYRRNPIRYRIYRANCGRDRRLKDLWGDAAGH